MVGSRRALLIIVRLAVTMENVRKKWIKSTINTALIVVRLLQLKKYLYMNNGCRLRKLSIICKRKNQIQLLTHIVEKLLVHIDLLK
jgi:hypothetical protein